MLIQCCIPEHDNIVKFGLSVYRFKKNGNGHLVCNVEDEDARNKLLERPEYKVYTCEEEPEDDDPNFGDPVPDPEQSAPAANINEPLTREYLSQRTYEELREIFQHRFGKAAHPSSKHETLIDRLAE